MKASATRPRSNVDARLDEQPLYLLAALLLFLLLAGATEYAFNVAGENALREQRVQVVDDAARMRDLIDIELNSTVHLATGMVAYIQAKQGLDAPDELRSMLGNLFRHGRSIRNIGIAPGNRLTHVYPIEGNEKAVGLYYPEVPAQWPAVERVMRERQARLAGPLQLAQGGTGLVYRVPVFVEGGRYWGLVSTVIDVDKMFAAIGFDNPERVLRFALRGKDGLGSEGEVFHGDAALFAGDSVRMDIKIPGGRWQLAAVPAGGWVVPAHVHWLRRAGWLIAALAAFVLHQQLAAAARRRQIAALQRVSEERYRLLFTESQAAMLLIDPDGGAIVEANTAACAYYGYGHDEIRRLKIYDINMLSPDEVTAEMTRARREQRNHFIFRHRLASGELRDVEVRSGPIEIDGRLMLYSIVFDVTERRRLEADRNRLALAVEQSPASIVIVDPTGNIEYVNAAFCEKTGYSLAEVIGKNPRLLKSGHTRPEAYRAMWRRLAAGQAWSGVFHNRRKDGELFWERAHISPVTDESGAITHYLGIKEDITEQRRAEAELVKAKEAAEAASRVKSQFLANMSHEIRTPMNGIIGMAQLLRHTELSVEQREFADIIKTSAESLLGILNDILDLSKIEAGRLELEREPFDLRHVVHAVVEFFGIEASQKNLPLEVAVADAVPEIVHGDAKRLRQILINLIGNALKFTTAGRIAIAVATEDLPDGALGLRIAVSDTGIGMAAEVVDGLFAPFFQGDASVTRRFGGTGLGLSICRRLAELMRGRIEVQSQPGVGSTFILRLPLETNAGAVSSTGQAGEVASRLPSDVNVLVVDDDDTSRRVALQLLTRLGVAAHAVANGAEALAALRRETFDLVLMDCQMPVMDGYETTRRIRHDEAGVGVAAIPIVAVTANVMKGEREACLAAGMNDYLAKPYGVDELAARLTAWLATTEETD